MAKTKEEKLAAARAWKARNRDHVKASRAKYYAAHREHERATNEAWKAQNPERYAAVKARCDAAYRDANRETLRAYFRSNQHRQRRNARARERYHSEPVNRVGKILRASLRQALRLHGNGRKTEAVTALIGCSVAGLVAHIESQFQPGMSWDNAGAWHIDHRRPCASFDLSDLAQQRECFHYSNLQPLWAIENLRKGDR